MCLNAFSKFCIELIQTPVGCCNFIVTKMKLSLLIVYTLKGKTFQNILLTGCVVLHLETLQKVKVIFFYEDTKLQICSFLAFSLIIFVCGCGFTLSFWRAVSSYTLIVLQQFLVTTCAIYM